LLNSTTSNKNGFPAHKKLLVLKFVLIAKRYKEFFCPRKVPGREFAPVLGATENAGFIGAVFINIPPTAGNFARNFAGQGLSARYL
jgi:hypothetical protein